MAESVFVLSVERSKCGRGTSAPALAQELVDGLAKGERPDQHALAIAAVAAAMRPHAERLPSVNQTDQLGPAQEGLVVGEVFDPAHFSMSRIDRIHKIEADSASDPLESIELHL
jgi:hypothetical protein